MRGLMLSVSLIALAGAAFAGEPQTSSPKQAVASVQKHVPAVASMRAPQKMTDQQLQNIVAGAAGELAMMNHDRNMSLANVHCVGGPQNDRMEGWHAGSPAAMMMPGLNGLC